MNNKIKASEYAAFCYLYIIEMKYDMNEYGHVVGYDGVKYTDWEFVVEDCKKQFTAYYEDDMLIEQDVTLNEALGIAGLK